MYWQFSSTKCLFVLISHKWRLLLQNPKYSHRSYLRKQRFLAINSHSFKTDVFQSSLIVWFVAARNIFSHVFNIPFSSVQSLSRVWLFATPWTAEHQTFLSITNSQSFLKVMSIKSVMPSNHLILCHPLLRLPSIFPSIRVFSNESVWKFAIWGHAHRGKAESCWSIRAGMSLSAWGSWGHFTEGAVSTSEDKQGKAFKKSISGWWNSMCKGTEPWSKVILFRDLQAVQGWVAGKVWERDRGWAWNGRDSPDEGRPLVTVKELVEFSTLDFWNGSDSDLRDACRCSLN